MPGIEELEEPRIQPDYSNLPMGELQGIIKSYQQFMLKSVSKEAQLTSASKILQGAFTAELRGKHTQAVLLLAPFRAYLITVGPFYTWARDILVRFPQLEVEELLEGGSKKPIMEVMNMLASRIAYIRGLRDKYQREMPKVEGTLSKKLSMMFRKQESREEERQSYVEGQLKSRGGKLW